MRSENACIHGTVFRVSPVVWLSAPRTEAGSFDEYCSKGELADDDDNWKPAEIIDRCRDLFEREREKKTWTRSIESHFFFSYRSFRNDRSLVDRFIALLSFLSTKQNISVASDRDSESMFISLRKFPDKAQKIYQRFSTTKDKSTGLSWRRRRRKNERKKIHWLRSSDQLSWCV